MKRYLIPLMVIIMIMAVSTVYVNTAHGLSFKPFWHVMWDGDCWDRTYEQDGSGWQGEAHKHNFVLMGGPTFLELEIENLSANNPLLVYGVIAGETLFDIILAGTNGYIPIFVSGLAANGRLTIKYLGGGDWPEEYWIEACLGP